VARQQKLWFHPGLNVTYARANMHLIALKEGVVRVSCEKPDLNWDHSWNKLFYAGREGQTFYKKYFNIIPKPQHTRFKCIDQV
jgi:large subunit ribosomal protein L27